MIKNSTTIILGAGASKPYGFPLGFELRDQVLRIPERSLSAFTLSKFGVSEGQLKEFCYELSTSGYSSVDAFLEDRPKWTEVGKRAMALRLVAFEMDCRARIFPPRQPKDHWYQALWSRLKAPSLKAFKEQPMNIITFNYDRSLEHYLAHVLCNNYSISPSKAIASFSILHVHGSLGVYEVSDFKKLGNEKMDERAANSIRVVHDANIKKSEFIAARRMILSSGRILFIGFG